MAFAVCPECGEDFDLPPRTSGRKAQCPTCQTIFNIKFEDSRRVPFVPIQELPQAVKSDSDIEISEHLQPLDPAIILRRNGFGRCVDAASLLGWAFSFSPLVLVIGQIVALFNFMSGPMAGFATMFWTLMLFGCMRVCGAAGEILLAIAHRFVREGVRGDTQASSSIPVRRSHLHCEQTMPGTGGGT